jgi:hypothetical protein
LHNDCQDDFCSQKKDESGGGSESGVRFICNFPSKTAHLPFQNSANCAIKIFYGSFGIGSL